MVWRGSTVAARWGRLLICSLMIVATPAQHADSARPSIRSELRQLRRLTLIDGCKVAADGHPGQFFRIASRVLKRASAADYKRMLADEAPAVRIMGALGIALVHPELRSEVQALKSDTAAVQWVAYGCVIRESAVGAITQAILRNPEFFGLASDGSTAAWCRDDEAAQQGVEADEAG